jgi:hypothetical protein
LNRGASPKSFIMHGRAREDDSKKLYSQIANLEFIIDKIVKVLL